MESLSAYARQFLERMEKHDVDTIEGLSPAIAIEQKTASHNPRSTVGTVTEIYDYLRLLFARVGTSHCYKCGRPITSQTLDQIVDQIMTLEKGSRIFILSPLVTGQKGTHEKLFKRLIKEGFTRVSVNCKILEIEEVGKLDKKKKTHYPCGGRSFGHKRQFKESARRFFGTGNGTIGRCRYRGCYRNQTHSFQ